MFYINVSRKQTRDSQRANFHLQLFYFIKEHRNVQSTLKLHRPGEIASYTALDQFTTQYVPATSLTTIQLSFKGNCKGQINSAIGTFITRILQSTLSESDIHNSSGNYTKRTCFTCEQYLRYESKLKTIKVNERRWR